MAQEGNAPAAQPQEAPKQFSVNYRERPRYPFDRQRLKRRPVLDGIIAEGEWDPLYTISDGPVTGTVYLNWDDDYLYIAAKTDQPAWAIFDIDANDDGWLRGADNLEITVAPVTAGVMPPITARILDAASGKDQPVWNDRVVDTKAIQIAAKATGSNYVIELAVPKGIAGLMPRANATIGFRADFLPAGQVPTPTPPYEPHLLVDVDLVDARVTGAPGVSPRLTLEDQRVIPGGTLNATLELIPGSDEPIPIRWVAWSGDGAAADILLSERNPNVPPVNPRKSLKLRYSCRLPDTAVPGFYQLSASAELANGRSVHATASFQVVEPFVLTMSASPEPAFPSDQNKERVTVEIQCAVPGYTRGDVELQVPAGWVIEGRHKKGFESQHQDSVIRPQFFVVIPSATQPGDYVLHARVTWHKREWRTSHILHVERAAPAPAPQTTTPGKS
ncbi:MAG: NEW3 domain-containing protein [Chthonomonadales bacterium]